MILTNGYINQTFFHLGFNAFLITQCKFINSFINCSVLCEIHIVVVLSFACRILENYNTQATQRLNCIISSSFVAFCQDFFLHRIGCFTQLITRRRRSKTQEVIKSFFFHVQLLHKVLDVSCLSFIENFRRVDFFLLLTASTKLLFNFISSKAERSEHLNQPF